MYGIKSHVLSPEESLKVHPLLNVKDLYGTLYSPLDGTIDPAGACTTYTRAATKYGAKVGGLVSNFFSCILTVRSQAWFAFIY